MHAKTIIYALLTAVQTTVFAAVPVKWAVETSRVQPIPLNAYHGESISMEATMLTYGKPLDLDGQTATLYWQTNGMGTAWWSTNATVSATNVLCATWRGDFDTGADLVNGFIKAGDGYRAAFTIRFRPSPGWNPSALPIPTRVLDFATTTVTNAPYWTKDEADARYSGSAVTPTTVTNIAAAVASNTVTKAYVEGLGIEAGISAATSTNIAAAVASNTVTKAYVESLGIEAGISATTSTNIAAAVASNTVTKAFVEGLGIEAGISATTSTNIAAAVASNTVTKAYVEGLGIEAGISAETATNIAEAIVTEAVKPAYSWSRPNEWTVALAYSSTSNGVETTLVSTDSYSRVYHTKAVTTFHNAYADATTKVLDESSISPAPAVTWASLDPACSITAAGRVTASSNGLYRVSATSAAGTIRYADVAINSSYSTTATGQRVYSADANGRKTINDAALTILTAATSAGTGTYDGQSYTIWNTFTPKMSGTGAGNVRCWAVSPHILASAKHYTAKPLGTQTFTDGSSTATVTKKAWVNLADWAMTNGWTQAEIAAMRISDIDLIVCDSATAVPDGCIPYFVGAAKWADMCGGYANGIVAWCANQTYQYAQPLVLNNRSWDWEMVPQGQSSTVVRADIMTRLTAMGYACPIHSGDSGHPVFVMYNGYPVIVSQFTTTDNGPDYVSGFDVIKAFVAAHGDTIKEVQ